MPATQRVQRDRSSRPKALFALEAQQLLARGEARQAVELCKRGLAYYPANPTGYVVLAQSYIQLDEKERALNVLQDGYRRTGSDRLNELALELSGERAPAPEEHSAQIVDEADAGLIPLEEIAVEEIYPPLAEPAARIQAEPASPEPEPITEPAPEDHETSIAVGDASMPLASLDGLGIGMQEDALLMELPPIGEVNGEPESVEDEVMTMEIEIAEIEPESSMAPGLVDDEEPPFEEPLPEPGFVFMPEMEPEATGSPDPATDVIPGIAGADSAAQPLPDDTPAIVPGDESSREPEQVIAEPEIAISEPEPETAVAGPEPEITSMTEEISSDTAAVEIAEEIPVPPAIAEEPLEMISAEPVRKETQEETPTEPEEPMAPPAGLAQTDQAETLVAGPEPLAEMTTAPDEAIAAEPPAEEAMEQAEPAAAIIPDIPPAEEAPAGEMAAEPVAQTEAAEQPVLPEPAARIPEPTAAEPAIMEPVIADRAEPPVPAATDAAVQETPAREPLAMVEMPAPPMESRMPEFAPLSVRSREPGREEQGTTARRENIVQLGSQQPPPLHTAVPQQPTLTPLRTVEGRGGMEAETSRSQGGTAQGAVQERPRPLALHMGKNIARLRSSNLRLIPGLEFAPLRHEDQTRKQSIAPLISEPMPMPVADSSFRTQRTLEEKELNLPPLPLLADAGPGPEGLRIGEPEMEALPLLAPEPMRQEEPPAGEMAVPAAVEVVIEEEPEALGLLELPGETEAAGEGDPFAGNILQMVQAMQKASELTPLEELARRLENARIPVVEEVTEHRPVFTTSIVSETLANILVSQGAFAEAMKAFQTLARTKPERFDYFQERIWEMKWRISNPDLPWPPDEPSLENADPAL